LDANLNPTLIPVVVEILMEMARHGVQIFLATHDYNLMKYFSISKKPDDNVAFYSLSKTDGYVTCENEDDYDQLTNNPIIAADIKLLEDEMGI